jgi:hypothetical protein
MGERRLGYGGPREGDGGAVRIIIFGWLPGMRGKGWECSKESYKVELVF